MKTLTIVIPSYNTETFIDKNMKTFLDERLYDQAEILIVNDGSKDRTAELAKKYEEKYGGYIRLIDKENGGHGSVINRGIKEAQSKYFKVIDADDWVNTENLVRLVSDLKKSDADVVINPYVEVNQQTDKEKICGYKEIQSLQPESPIDLLVEKNVHFMLHSVTYKTSILRDNHITVTEKCFYEDCQYDLYPVPYLKTVTILDYPVYWYLIGQKTQSVDAANALKNVDMAFKVFCDMVEFYRLNKNGFTKLVDEYFQRHICVFLRSIYNVYLRNNHDQYIVDKMIGMDCRIKANASDYYYLISKNNFYIKLMRTENKIIFQLLALAYRINHRLR